MDSTARVREMAAEGHPASSIAKALGISRQRVHQICKKAQIPLRSYHAVASEAAPRAAPKPRARVITGGVPQEINHSTAGVIAELLVAADLMARGWQVYMPVVASRGHDLIAVMGERMLTVEVRSAYRNPAGRLIFAKKPDCRSATYALVVTGEPVTYEPSL